MNEQSGSIDEIKQREYRDYIEDITPTHKLWKQMLHAFIVGGIICTCGQGIINFGTAMGMEQQDASSWCSLVLILISVILTGFGLYTKISKWGGAGALVPITGFANSVAACAHGFKVEGQVFGVGARIFQIAGPVILYGLLTTAGLGLIYWFMGTF